MSGRCGALDVALRAWALSCRGLGAGADCGLLGRLVSLRAGARLTCLWRSRPGAWRLCSIAIFLRVACFLCSVCLEPFYYHGNRSQAYSCCPVYSPLYPKTVPYLSHTYLEPRASFAK